MMRHWREREFAQQLSPPAYRAGLALWACVAPPAGALPCAGRDRRRGCSAGSGATRGRFRSLPLAGGWTSVRDMPAPEGRSFHSLWAERQRARTPR